jgi:uncharacterized protein (TIGR02996 family)
MTQHAGFLAAILAEPEEDAHRLVFADYLEEHGGQRGARHAALIRVQCRLARLDERRCGGYYCDTFDDGTTRHVDCEWGQLEQEQWPLLGWAQDYLVPAATAGSAHFVRGFADAMTLPLSRWWRYGPAAVRMCPTLRMVCLTDRAPGVHTGRLATVHFWADGWRMPPAQPAGDTSEPYFVPTDWLLRMDPPLTSDHSHGYQGWPTRKGAVRALSDVALAWAREGHP